MLISESLMGNLSGNLDIKTVIFDGLKRGIQLHFEKYHLSIDSGMLVQQIAEILVSNVLFYRRNHITN